MQITKWLEDNIDFCISEVDRLRKNPRRKPVLATREHRGKIQNCVKDESIKLVNCRLIYVDNGESVIHETV